MKPTRKKSRLKWLRYLSQFSIVAFLVAAGIRHQLIGGGPIGAAPIDSYCVFGGIETLWNYLTTGEFLPKTNTSNLVLLGGVFLLLIVTGASFCGWLCPFGSIQGALAKLGRWIFKRNLQLPEKIDRPLRYLRYVVLGLIIIMTIRTGTLWFEGYDPFKAIFHFNIETTTAWILIGSTIILSILIERFWCKYLCPLGAFFSLIAPISFLNIKRKEPSCLSCSRCNRSCPMGLNVAKADVLKDGQCIKCLECVETCPSHGTLSIKTAKKGISPWSFSLIVLLLFWGAISIGMATETWKTTVRGLETTEMISVEDIKGWMTLKEISQHTGIPLHELLKLAELPESTNVNKKLKDIAHDKGFEVDELKEKIAQNQEK